VGFDFGALFAANGYAVFQPNFRGSSGYGQKFIDADRADFGNGDMNDILTGVDTLIRNEVVDKKRMFVYGISYGGYMTSWLVGQTERFRAAVAQNAVTDLTMMWSLSDLQSWTEWEFRGRPWQVPEAMRKHSPMTYVNKVKTPTLILHSGLTVDVRCPWGRLINRL
jgi:dipeptidyl aminopeptidase/acylaminoacyl peptidase